MCTLACACRFERFPLVRAGGEKGVFFWLSVCQLLDVYHLILTVGRKLNYVRVDVP